jgi:hypothetical protein
MRKSQMCLSVVHKPNFHLLSLSESEALCQNLTCDGLTIRLPVTNNRDKMTDAFRVAIVNLGGGFKNYPRKLVNLTHFLPAPSLAHFKNSSAYFRV